MLVSLNRILWCRWVSEIMTLKSVTFRDIFSAGIKSGTGFRHISDIL